MSERNNPNINAAGLVIDIVNAIDMRIRGKAKEAGLKVILPLLSADIEKFANNVSEFLDQAFEGEDSLFRPGKKKL